MSMYWYASQSSAMAASMDARAAQRSAGEARIKVSELQARCDRAMMVCEALFHILQDKLGVTEEDLVQRINDIDLSDGTLDGRAKKSSAVTCPSCSRVIAKRFPRCIYCGQPIVHDPFA
jgi:hypothetical protein